jgi:hypothetical protein
MLMVWFPGISLGVMATENSARRDCESKLTVGTPGATGWLRVGAVEASAKDEVRWISRGARAKRWTWKNPSPFSPDEVQAPWCKPGRCHQMGPQM